MAKKPLPTPEELRQLLSYDPETGKLFWKERTPEMFPSGNTSREANCRAWNKKWAGREAFTAINMAGYKVGNVSGGSPKRAHRVAWAIHYGKWPDKDIDHINGDPADNRLCNLREANQMENQQNRKARSCSNSGHIGVRFYKNGWAAEITAEGEKFYLGRYKTREGAIAAYLKAKERLHTFNPYVRRMA